MQQSFHQFRGHAKSESSLGFHMGQENLPLGQQSLSKVQFNI